MDCLLEMAEVEWDHEAYFRSKVTGHFLTRVFKVWRTPAAALRRSARRTRLARTGRL